MILEKITKGKTVQDMSYRESGKEFMLMSRTVLVLNHHLTVKVNEINHLVKKL